MTRQVATPREALRASRASKGLWKATAAGACTSAFQRSLVRRLRHSLLHGAHCGAGLCLIALILCCIRVVRVLQHRHVIVLLHLRRRGISHAAGELGSDLLISHGILRSL